MNGDLDGRTSIERAKEVAKYLKNSTFITIKNASHNFWMLSPEIPDAMLAFLQGEHLKNREIEDPLFEFRSPFEDEMVDQLYEKIVKADAKAFTSAFKALQNGPKYMSSSILASLLTRLNQENKTDQAIEVMKLAVSEYPRNWRFHQSLGEAYLRVGNKELAHQSLDLSLSLNPYNLRASAMLQN
jgi:Flp pilus assembly protein TadD